jgi:hypothetical protein
MEILEFLETNENKNKIYQWHGKNNDAVIRRMFIAISNSKEKKIQISNLMEKQKEWEDKNKPNKSGKWSGQKKLNRN